MAIVRLLSPGTIQSSPSRWAESFKMLDLRWTNFANCSSTCADYFCRCTTGDRLGGAALRVEKTWRRRAIWPQVANNGSPPARRNRFHAKRGFLPCACSAFDRLRYGRVRTAWVISADAGYEHIGVKDVAGWHAHAPRRQRGRRSSGCRAREFRARLRGLLLRLPSPWR
jgi:hypothetical protein